MSEKYDIVKDPPKALTFDVFGTVVDWRSTVVATLIRSAAAKTSSSSRSASLTLETRQRLSKLKDSDWAQFAQEWRNSYKKYVSSFDPQKDEWKDIDTHHHLSLIDLLKKWKLEDLYTPDEIHELSLKLGTKFITSTLSNGNQSLLKDLNNHGNLGFKLLQSSADFKAYKPHPSVYKGAAQVMGLKPSEVAMVAAHLNDLKAARGCGFRTVYVEREGEEDWEVGSGEWEDAKGWVDLWVRKDEGEGDGDGGFLEVARRFEVE
ncbi:haloacid dehalogenase [Acephala macrosclerotiorum]|nr:haloacid dehalogenase [Acephala macrosclerotiorum]